MPELIIVVFMAELATIVGDMLDNIIVSDDIMVFDIVILDVFMVDIVVEVFIVADIIAEDIMVDIMVVAVSWFDDGRTKPPMPAAARALRVETIMAMLRMLDFRFE